MKWHFSACLFAQALCGGHPAWACSPTGTEHDYQAPSISPGACCYREGGSNDSGAPRESEGRGLFASLVSAAADKRKKLSFAPGRTARVSAESTVPLKQQSTPSRVDTVRRLLTDMFMLIPD